MSRNEYKVIYARPGGAMAVPWVVPWASQKIPDAFGPSALEKTLNGLADEGWEVVSCTTSPLGSWFSFHPMATIILRREET
jgi:hypothetical protein